MTRRILLTAILTSMLSFTSPAFAGGGETFKFGALGSGAQEGPVPVDTPTVARTTVRFDEGLRSVTVRVAVRHLPAGVDVTAAHFHCGRAGSNGPVVLGMINPGPLTIGANGVISGTLTNSDVLAACEPYGSNIASLLFAMRDGLIYVNVHTNVNGSGEARGQMLPR